MDSHKFHFPCYPIPYLVKKYITKRNWWTNFLSIGRESGRRALLDRLKTTVLKSTDFVFQIKFEMVSCDNVLRFFWVFLILWVKHSYGELSSKIHSRYFSSAKKKSFRNSSRKPGGLFVGWYSSYLYTNELTNAVLFCF